MRRRRLPGYRWRVLAHADSGDRVAISREGNEADQTCFDELVIDDWFHIEQMDTRHWWIGLAGLSVNVYVPPAGKPEVLIEDDDPSRHGRLRLFVKQSPPPGPEKEKEKTPSSFVGDREQTK